MDAPDPPEPPASPIVEEKTTDTTPPQKLLTPKELHGYWAAIYDVLRPTGELDSRAKTVLVSSLGLIALCVSAQKPSSLSLAGMIFKTDKWIVLAIAIALVVAYSVVQLCLAWTIHNQKIEHSIAAPLGDIGLWMNTLTLQSQSRLEHFMEMAEKDKQRRAEAMEWYKKQHQELSSRRNSLMIDGAADYFTEMQAINDEAAQLSSELDRRILTPEGRAYESEVDAVIDDTIAGAKSESFNQMAEAGQIFNKVIKLKTTRLAIDLWFPLILAASSFAIFIMTVLRALI